MELAGNDMLWADRAICIEAVREAILDVHRDTVHIAVTGYLYAGLPVAGEGSWISVLSCDGRCRVSTERFDHKTRHRGRESCYDCAGKACCYYPGQQV